MKKTTFVDFEKKRRLNITFNQYEVLDTVKNGIKSIGGIATDTGLGKATVSDIVKKLKKRDFLGNDLSLKIEF